MRITGLKISLEATINTGNFENRKPRIEIVAALDVDPSQVSGEVDILLDQVRKDLGKEVRKILKGDYFATSNT